MHDDGREQCPKDFIKNACKFDFSGKDGRKISPLKGDAGQNKEKQEESGNSKRHFDAWLA